MAGPTGIDVYAKTASGGYQTVTNWTQVRGSGIEYVWIKLSDGLTSRDDGGYTANARANGLYVGGYHFAQAGDPVAQAQYFLARLNAVNAKDLAPALDAEAAGTTGVDFIVPFLKTVAAAGHRPALYANNSVMASVLAAVKAQVPNVLVWVARYGATPDMAYNNWQYSQTGSVSGITEQVDLNTGSIPKNIYNGDGLITPKRQDEEDAMQPTYVPPAPNGGVSYVTIPWTGEAAVLNVVGTSSPVFVAKPGNWGPNGGMGGGDSTVAGVNPARVEVNQPGQYTVPAGTTRIFYSASCASGHYVQAVSV